MCRQIETGRCRYASTPSIKIVVQLVCCEGVYVDAGMRQLQRLWLGKAPDSKARLVIRAQQIRLLAGHHNGLQKKPLLPSSFLFSAPTYSGASDPAAPDSKPRLVIRAKGNTIAGRLLHGLQKKHLLPSSFLFFAPIYTQSTSLPFQDRVLFVELLISGILPRSLAVWWPTHRQMQMILR